MAKMIVCRNCNTAIPKKVKKCPACGAKNKKSFFKKGCFIILLIIVIIAVSKIIGGGNKGDKFKWADIELSSVLPEPKSKIGEIFMNTKDELSINVYKTDSDDYKDYLGKCQTSGFVVESEEIGDGYTAYNESGYKLDLWYVESNKYLSIQLDAPMEMETLQWPTSEIANLLPVPKSTIGKISQESSDKLFIYVGETSLDDYNTYVDECSEKGFTVDYDKGDKYYRANNENGYHLSLSYEGNNMMTIEIDKEEDSAESASSSEKKDSTSSGKSKSSSKKTTKLVNGMRPKFKKAMDSYEDFIDEYCKFMKKYAKSDGTDLELLADYADYMDKYAKAVEDFEAWEEKELNDVETAYYLKVQTRISKKISKLAN